MDNSKYINQMGDKSFYIENNEGDITINNIQPSSLTDREIIESFNSASIDLSEYPNTFGGIKHIVRSETEQLFNWVISDLQKDKSPIGILAGNAGYGKSVIFRDLYQKLKENNIPVLGIKADRLIIRNSRELNEELQLSDNFEAIFKKIAQSYPRLVLLIDQIDALSQSLSSDRSPINTYHRIINRLSFFPNIRIVISCRIYDLDYDPILQQYRNKQIFKTSTLSISQVEEVLQELHFEINRITPRFKEFLRIPLHLQIFCKINHQESVNDVTTLQHLYDSLWNEYIITKSTQNHLVSENVIKFIEELSDKMYKEQQIVADSRLFIDRYKQEIEYLNTNEIININSTYKIQFVHQSFFDYVFARLFVQKGENLSENLNNQHQGLFIRSKVKQVLDYLRELAPKQYINEVETILFGNFRFHIKLLIINNLGYYENPTIAEKYFVKNKLINSEYFKIFIEAINSSEWFIYLTKEIGLEKYFLSRNDDETQLIYPLCRKLIDKCPLNVVDFLSSIPDDYETKNYYIGRALIGINEKDVDYALELFNKGKHQWDDFSYYHFLEKLIKKHPLIVVDELDKKLIEFSDKGNLAHIYIPNPNDTSEILKKLYEFHPEIAIVFFINVIRFIAEKSKIPFKEIYSNEYYSDLAYIFYVPFKDNRYDLHFEIFDIVLSYFEKKLESNLQEAKIQILPLLESNFTSVLNLPLTLLIKYPQNFIHEIFYFLTKPNFLNQYSAHSLLFTYNVRELLKASYTYFSQEQKQKLNKLILNIKPEIEKSKNEFSESHGVSQYGYSRFELPLYQLLSMIPKNERKINSEINAKYIELNRKFGEIKNSKPEGIVVRSGDIVMAEKAYHHMTIENWKNSFRKYVDSEKRSWDGVSELGHNRMFEEIVSKEPEKYFNLIEEIIEDKSISQSYSIYGLQGLTKSDYDPIEIRRLFIKCLEFRKDTIEKEYVQYLVWLTDYFINKNSVNDDVIKFIVDIVTNFPDSIPLNNDPIFDGINSVRGAAVDRLVKCYRFKNYQDMIFSTLENIALSSAPHTRACALLHLAVLNNIDKERNIKLFLLLNHDFHPKLISIGLYVENPSNYFFNTNEDYLKLVPFLRKSIEIEEAHEVITNVIFWAWLSNYHNSEELLNKALEASIRAKSKAIEVAFGHLKYQKFFEKCLTILKLFLNIDNKELGERYEHEFIHLAPELFLKLNDFLNEYTNSEVGKYRGYNFYQYLLRVSKDQPEKCIELALNFKTHLKPDIQSHISNKTFASSDSILQCDQKI